jgi:hypothetical protein
MAKNRHYLIDQNTNFEILDWHGPVHAWKGLVDRPVATFARNNEVKLLAAG